MATDYTYLYEEYPEVISADQLYRICHISKRKAKWLLEHGYIPCEDSGKKTRRYKIRLNDVIDYEHGQGTPPLPRDELLSIHTTAARFFLLLLVFPDRILFACTWVQTLYGTCSSILCAINYGCHSGPS